MTVWLAAQVTRDDPILKRESHFAIRTHGDVREEVGAYFIGFVHVVSFINAG